jgi:hypothetical protein
LISTGTDRGRDPAVGVEGGVEAAVAVVASEANVVRPEPGARATPGRDELPVALDRYRGRRVGEDAEGGRDLAVGVEGAVEAAVARVAGNAEDGGGP